MKMYNITIRKIREDNNLTCEDIANKLSVSSSIYRRWENNIITIPTKRLIELANIYEVNIDFLLGLTDKKYHIKSEPINQNLMSKRLRQIRNEHGETLRIFCKRLNTSNSTWHAYESGKNIILCSFLIQMCIESGYSADWILGLSDIKFIDK